MIKSNNPHLAGGEIGIKKKQIGLKKTNKDQKKQTRKEGRKEGAGRKEGRKEGSKEGRKEVRKEPKWWVLLRHIRHIMRHAGE